MKLNNTIYNKVQSKIFQKVATNIYPEILKNSKYTSPFFDMSRTVVRSRDENLSCFSGYNFGRCQNVHQGIAGIIQRITEHHVQTTEGTE